MKVKIVLSKIPRDIGSVYSLTNNKVLFMTIYEREGKFREEVCDAIRWPYPSQMLTDFFYYWTEPNRSGTKMKFELEKTWDTKRRLKRWYDNNKKWNNGSNRENNSGTGKRPAKSAGAYELLNELKTDLGIGRGNEDN